MHRLLILSTRGATVEIIILCTLCSAKTSFTNRQLIITSEAAFAIVMTSSMPTIAPIVFSHGRTADGWPPLSQTLVLCEENSFHFKARLLPRTGRQPQMTKRHQWEADTITSSYDSYHLGDGTMTSTLLLAHVKRIGQMVEESSKKAAQHGSICRVFDCSVEII